VIFNKDGDIYRIPDSTQDHIEQLIFTPSISEHHLLVSEYGDQIVFRAGFGDPEIASSEKGNHIYLLDTESKGFIDVTTFLVDFPQVWNTFSMDWLPNQEQFLVVRVEGQQYERENYLDFIGFDGKIKKQFHIEPIGEVPALIHSAELSPDGKKAVLTQIVIGGENQLKYPGAAILVYDFESKETTQLTTYEDHCMLQEWSPTSKEIIVSCSYTPTPIIEGVSGPSTLRIINIENPNAPESLIGLSSCDYPTWSPDGIQIATLCEKDSGQKGLFILNTEYYEIHEVFVGDPVNLSQPIWSPDGERIIYAAGPDYEHRKIYSIRPDGSDKHILTSEAGGYGIVAVYPIP
jgi:WD40 repeat protein